jgi:hypothetical protein
MKASKSFELVMISRAAARSNEFGYANYEVEAARQ